MPWSCARPTGGRYILITDDPAQCGEGAKAKGRMKGREKTRGPGQYKGRDPKAPVLCPTQALLKAADVGRLLA